MRTDGALVGHLRTILSDETEGWLAPAVAVGSPTNVKLTADAAGKTDATLVNTGLTFALTSGVYYAFRFLVVWRSTVLTVGLKLGVTTPTFTVYSARVSTIIAADGVGAAFDGALTTSGDFVLGTAVPAINTDFLTVVEGVILPSANGSLTIQYAAETTGATVTMRRGSVGTLSVI